MKVEIFHFAKYEINTKNLFRQISPINLAKFHRKSFGEVGMDDTGSYLQCCSFLTNAVLMYSVVILLGDVHEPLVESFSKG
jgi:hypothetical protein